MVAGDEFVKKQDFINLTKKGEVAFGTNLAWQSGIRYILSIPAAKKYS